MLSVVKEPEHAHETPEHVVNVQQSRYPNSEIEVQRKATLGTSWVTEGGILEL